MAKTKGSGKLDSPPIRDAVVKHVAAGGKQAELADFFNIDGAQVSRFVNRPDIREAIEKEQQTLIDVLPDAMGNVKDLVRTMKNLDEKDYRGRELSYKASKQVLQSVGLFPVAGTSQTLIQIYEDNRGQVLEANVLQLISQCVNQQDAVDNLEAFDVLTDDSVIDADIVDSS